jgi:site-specific recombinase XerC
LSNWLGREGVGVKGLHAKEVERFQRDRYAAGYRSLPSIRAMQPILGYLRDLGIAPAALPAVTASVLEAFVERFHTYLTVERGVLDKTAFRYIHLIRPFLQTRMLPDGLALDFRSLTAGDVISFVVKTCPPLNPGMAGVTVAALRSILGFLHIDGKIDRSLLSAVPTVPGRRLTGLPKALNPDEVKRLLASCDTTARSGFRDLAILTMLVRLGLRSGEVAKLELDDIDWRAGEIVIANSKGNRTERMPLPADVGEAVAAYLQYGRPVDAHGRTIFAGASAPHRALTNMAVSVIVARAAKRCGL